MKKLFCGILVFIGAAVFCAAEGIVEDAQKGNEKADTSYAFGMVVASDLMETGLEFNYNSFVRGFREAMEKEKTRYTMDEAMNKIQTAFTAAQAEIGKRNLEKGTAFLEENGKKPGVVTTASGLQYELVSEGSGEVPGPTDKVKVNYRGTTIDGTVFDSTYERGEPMEVPLDRVIPGWAEGLRMMKEGGKARLCIPPNLAYGEKGGGGAIGPNSVLVFDVELVSIVHSTEGEPAEGDAENTPNPEKAGQ